MKSPFTFCLSCCVLFWGVAFSAWSAPVAPVKTSDPTQQCLAFSPYVDKLNPNFGPSPSRELIDTLLDKIVAETPFRCIMTYGVVNGLEYTFAAAEARNIKVVAIIWLDNDVAVNSQSIRSGIEVARAFPETIVKLSCGSEVRTRNGYAFDGEISRCITALREAKVKQPITTIDTWWEWCDRKRPCKPTSFAQQVDWIGINVFPWWENRHADLFKCTPADQAAAFHLARYNDVQKTYPGKPVAITEFGWPHGPRGMTVKNQHTGKNCGLASPKDQALVVQSTLKLMQQKKHAVTVFEAFDEAWKASKEADVGAFWGVCSGTAPYSCAKFLAHLPK